jgi:hypothetical protein
MVKNFFILSFVLILMGCNPKIKTVIQKENVPVPVVPTPPNTERPKLYIDDLSEEDKKKDGEVSKAYVITTVQLKKYSTLLEQIVDVYRDLSKKSYNDYQLLEKLNPSSKPFSASNDVDAEVIEITSKPLFDFQSEYELWEAKQKLDKLNEEIESLKNSNDINIIKE